MKHFLVYIILALLHTTTMVGQDANRRNDAGSAIMTIKGRVLTEDGMPLSGVNIEGKMGRYATTDIRGYFTIPASLGDEITIRRADFETVYYRVRTSDDLEIRVTNDKETTALQRLSYTAAMDSAAVYMHKDAKKTADFLIAALSNNPKKITTAQQAVAYERLGDLYLFNKQADLAITNYTQSLALNYSTLRKRKQADALRLNGNYQEAINAYLSIQNRKNSSLIENLAINSGLADCYSATNQTNKAIETYNNALKNAQALNKTVDITALNTKLAKLLNNSGRVEEAQGYFNKAIAESKRQGPISNAVTQSQTADFYNSNAQYDKEIALREQNITILNNLNNKKLKSDAIAAVAEESIQPNAATSILPSVQQEQLKIGEALKAQNKTAEAITFFEKSFFEASNNDDLVTKKDASRNLATLYRALGNEAKAITYNEAYINTIDALYVLKEQELELSARRAKELASNQTRILTLEKDRELTENKITLINTEKELATQTNKRQQLVIYSLAVVAAMLLLLAYFMYRNNKQQKITNHLLALKSLRSQMNPHFIFNALNSVNSYIALNDERAANKYLTDFSKLMRSVLENSELDFIPLYKEIDLLSLYVKLEHERFKDKFDYTITIDPQLSTSDYPVPPMLLQPIVENAVWHGLRYKEEKGFLDIAFAKANTTQNSTGIQVTITDNGIGRERSKAIKTEHQKQRDSKGLGNVKNRITLLNELHDIQITMNVQNADLHPDIGTTVAVTMTSTNTNKAR